MQKDYGVVIITPDSIRDGLQNCILSDLLMEVGAKVIWQKYWRILNAQTVERIYPDLRGKFSYAAIVRTMLLGECLVVLLEGNDIYTKLKKAKGQIKYIDGQALVSGLRKKYRSWSEDELVRLGRDSEVTLEKVFEFRLHTSDDLADTANLCQLCMTIGETKDIQKIAPDLYQAILRLSG